MQISAKTSPIFYKASNYTMTIMTINASIHSVQKIYNGGRIAPEYTDCPFLQQIKKILSL